MSLRTTRRVSAGARTARRERGELSSEVLAALVAAGAPLTPSQVLADPSSGGTSPR